MCLVVLSWLTLLKQQKMKGDYYFWAGFDITISRGSQHLRIVAITMWNSWSKILSLALMSQCPSAEMCSRGWKNSNRLCCQQSLRGLFLINSPVLVLLTHAIKILTTRCYCKCCSLLSHYQGCSVATNISTSFLWELECGRSGAYLSSSGKTKHEWRRRLSWVVSHSFYHSSSQYLAFLFMSLLQEASGYMQTST